MLTGGQEAYTVIAEAVIVQVQTFQDALGSCLQQQLQGGRSHPGLLQVQLT